MIQNLRNVLSYLGKIGSMPWRPGHAQTKVAAGLQFLFPRNETCAVYKTRLRSNLITEKQDMDPFSALAAMAGGVVAVVAAPVVLGAAGFTSAGIVAGSIGAKMMSVAAIANGGGVAAGSLVAGLQSAGAAGLSGAASAAVATVGGAVASLANSID